MKKFLLLLLVILPLNTFGATQNIGYETIGTAGNDSLPQNQATCTNYLFPAGTYDAISMSIYINSFVENIKLIIWDNAPYSVIGVTPAITSGTGWVTATFSSPISLTPETEYCIGIVPNGSNTNWKYDSNSLDTYYDNSNNYTSPETFNVTAPDPGREKSMYVTIDGTFDSEPDPETSATSTASTTEMLLTGINFGIAIIITILSFGVVGYIFNTYNNRKKPWQK